MKSKILILIFSFLISNILSCDNGKSEIGEVLKNIIKSVPDLQKKVEKLPVCKTSELKPLCTKPYEHCGSYSEEHFFKGVSKNNEDIKTFFSLILDSLEMDTEHRKRLLLHLSTIKYSDFMEVTDNNVLDNKNTQAFSNNMLFSFFAESNCKNDDEFDFLYTVIKPEFKLSKDVFLLEESSGNFFGKTNSEIKKVEVNADLSREQYNALQTLLQVSVYSRALKLVEAFKG